MEGVVSPGSRRQVIETSDSVPQSSSTSIGWPSERLNSWAQQTPCKPCH